MTTLRLLVDLFCIVPQIAWAWVKTTLPRRKRRGELHCRDCGWRLPWDTASLICSLCQRTRMQRGAPTSRLFCCDVDLEYQSVRYERALPEDTSTIIKIYHCPSCARIWWYVETWYPDLAREADWHPQLTKAERASGDLPEDLFDERTRTTVYPKPFKL